MKNSLLFFLTLAFAAPTFAQQQYFFDKKFKTVQNYDDAKYAALSPSVNEKTFVIEIFTRKAYAEGVIYPSEVLSFDGKVVFYDKESKPKATKYYKKGVLDRVIAIDRSLAKAGYKSLFYLTTDLDGNFSAYQKANADIGINEDLLYASGRILDTFSLTLDGAVSFYSPNGEVKDVKFYQKGQEMPFYFSTADCKEP